MMPPYDACDPFHHHIPSEADVTMEERRTADMMQETPLAAVLQDVSIFLEDMALRHIQSEGPFSKREPLALRDRLRNALADQAEQWKRVEKLAETAEAVIDHWWEQDILRRDALDNALYTWRNSD